eukprot:84443-Prymnesium_polylepis.1
MACRETCLRLMQARDVAHLEGIRHGIPWLCTSTAFAGAIRAYAPAVSPFFVIRVVPCVRGARLRGAALRGARPRARPPTPTSHLACGGQ